LASFARLTPKANNASSFFGIFAKSSSGTFDVDIEGCNKRQRN
jgi:hypothetical protein